MPNATKPVKLSNEAAEGKRLEEEKARKAALKQERSRATRAKNSQKKRATKAKNKKQQERREYRRAKELVKQFEADNPGVKGVKVQTPLEELREVTRTKEPAPERTQADRRRGETAEQRERARAKRRSVIEAVDDTEPKPNPLIQVVSGTMSPKYVANDFPETFTAKAWADGTITLELFGHKLENVPSDRLVFPCRERGHIAFVMAEHKGDEIVYEREDISAQTTALRNQLAAEGG